MDWYRDWVWARRDNGPLPRPNRPCAGNELPACVLMHPKVYPGIGSLAKVIVSDERFDVMLEVP